MKHPHSFGRSLSLVLLKVTGVVLFLSACSSLYGQATTNISGIVNTYHRVIEIIPAKGCLRVASTAGLNVNVPVMVIQMKGAAINTSNTSSFGDTSGTGGLNGAGHYEIGGVCDIIGDSVFLFHQLLNSYDTAAKVQLVQFGEYYAAHVVDTVKALSWDSTRGTGGVIAIYADQDVTLDAPIYADSSGYRGGVYIHHAGDCPFAGTGWVYDASASGTNNGAYKGESVALISGTQDGAKAPPANGGGGGNNHNNSGGGGANLTTGGNGGGNSSSGPFGCNTGSNYGRGGRALSSWGGLKLFMGGGAGAGHSNNGAASQNFGGNGGGLVFIWATNLIGNGHTISARGGKGGNSFGDGAGGGGAGGTIVLNVTNYSGNATIAVTGGAGGDSFNDVSQVRCFGGGGGGSGGAIYFSGAVPGGGVSTSVSGGTGGLEPNRNAGCNTAVPGAAGSNGSAIPNYTFSRSFTVAGYCLYLLPSKLVYFQARPSGETVQLNWQVENPDLVQQFIVEKRAMNGDWISTASLDASTTRTNYAIIDRSPFAGTSFYRLKITERSQTVYYSETKRISFSSAPADFTLYPNPARGLVTVSGNFEPNSLLQVIDIGGRVAWQTKINNSPATLQLPPLSPGLYLIRCKEVVKKLVIY